MGDKESVDKIDINKLFDNYTNYIRKSNRWCYPSKEIYLLRSHVKLSKSGYYCYTEITILNLIIPISFYRHSISNPGQALNQILTPWL